MVKLAEYWENLHCCRLLHDVSVSVQPVLVCYHKAITLTAGASHVFSLMYSISYIQSHVFSPMYSVPCNHLNQKLYIVAVYSSVV